jgi:hypothetical protein
MFIQILSKARKSMVLNTNGRFTSIKLSKLILFLLFSFFGHNILALVPENSLIATRQGDIPIQYLHAGHKILSYDLNFDWIEEAPIRKLAASPCTRMHALELEFFNDDATVARGILYACSEQLFLNPENQRWIEAQNLRRGTFLLEGDGRICRIVKSEQITTLLATGYELELKIFHVFWMGVQALSSNQVYYVLVHNDPATIAVGGAIGLGAAAAVGAGIAGAAALYDFMTSGPSITNGSDSSNLVSDYSDSKSDDATSSSTIIRPAMTPSIPLLQAYPLSPTQQEDFNAYIHKNTSGSYQQVIEPYTSSSQQVSSSNASTPMPAQNETRAPNIATTPEYVTHFGQPNGIRSNQQGKSPCTFSENPYQRNAATLSFAREQSERAWQALIRRRIDMREKTRLFSHPHQACHCLRHIGLSIEQACEHDRFLLTLSCVVNLMLESPEGRRWILHEHEKIINDPVHSAKTEQIDGFIYKRGPFRWFWWKLFGKEKQYYVSGYQNRIAEIVAHIKDAEHRQKREKKDKDKDKNKDNNGGNKKKKDKKREQGDEDNNNKSNKDPKNNNEGPNRIINIMTKAEFFRRCSDRYEHWKNGIYRLKERVLGFFDGKAYYLQWDHLHNDVEVYSQNERHLGSLDPKTFELYKGPVFGRNFPGN